MKTMPMIFLCSFLIFIAHDIMPACASDGTKISIAVNVICGNVTTPSSVVVDSPMVNLTCCIERYPCSSYWISWYRNGSDKPLPHDKILPVNLVEAKETFTCLVEHDLNCYGLLPYNATITLMQGHCFDKAPVTFVESASRDHYALVGDNKTLSFHLKYVGIHITPFILVNDSHLMGISYIHHKFRHDINIETCIEDYNLTLINVTPMYCGNYTVYVSTNGHFNESARHDSVRLWACEKIEWYRDQSTVTPYASTYTATLQYVFKTCYSPNDDLVKFCLTKNKEHLDTSDKRYNVSHRQVNNSLYVITLTIYNTTTNDSGDYSCHVWYKESEISPLVLKTGTMYLNISGSAPSETTDSTDWQLTGGLIGGGVLLLVLLGVLVVIFRSPRPRPDEPRPKSPVVLQDDVPLIQQEYDLPAAENSEGVFTVPLQPESSRTPEESIVELHNASQGQSVPQLPRPPCPLSKPRTKVEQRLIYYKKDIVELLAGREKADVVAYLKQTDMLDKEQIGHFFWLDDPLQSYSYLIDAVLAAGRVVAERFYRYLIDKDVTDHFYQLVAPKAFLLYVITTGALEDNIQQFAKLLRQCGINVICDFYEPGIQDCASFNGHLWVQQKINDCIDSGGYVLVDVTTGPMNDLSHTHNGNPTMNMQYTQFDSKTLYQIVTDSRECFIPFCLDNPPLDKVFPFRKELVYRIDITEFYQRFVEYVETNYLDEFNVNEDSCIATQAFLNTAPHQFNPIVDLIRRLTDQQ